MGRREHIGPELIAKMRAMRESGMTVKEIAEETGYSGSAVSRHTASAGMMAKWAKWAKRDTQKHDPVPRREFHWTADKEYQQIQEARQRRRQYPCEHCRWRMNGTSNVACLCYRELWGAEQDGRKTRFGKAEIWRAAKSLNTTTEDAARILALWDNGGGVEDIVCAYKNAMGW